MIPRTDPKCTDHPNNLACICANCHNLVHALKIVIEGRYLTSSGYVLFWHRENEPYKIIPGIILKPDGTAVLIGENDGRKDIGCN